MCIYIHTRTDQTIVQKLTKIGSSTCLLLQLNQIKQSTHRLNQVQTKPDRS